jgi:hypothetical protein
MTTIQHINAIHAPLRSLVDNQVFKRKMGARETYKRGFYDKANKGYICINIENEAMRICLHEDSIVFVCYAS